MDSIPGENERKNMGRKDYVKNVIIEFIKAAKKVMEDELDNEFKRKFLEIISDLEAAENIREELKKKTNWFKENSFYIVSLRIDRTSEIYCILR